MASRYQTKEPQRPVCGDRHLIPFDIYQGRFCCRGIRFPVACPNSQRHFCGRFSKHITQPGDNAMSLKLVSGMMKSSGDEALLMMDADGTNQMVVIEKEALLDIADPPRCDESRLQENIDLFSRIASAKYDRGDIERDGRIRISSDDLVA
ncbi:hypothetical protein [Rhizobium leguminosarum]